MPSGSFAQSRASAWTRWYSLARGRCDTRSVNSRNTTTGSVIIRVWATGLFDRNSFRIRNTARCDVARDWADCSIITIVRQHESDHTRIWCAVWLPLRSCAIGSLNGRSPMQASRSARSASGHPSPRRGAVESDFVRKLRSGNQEPIFSTVRVRMARDNERWGYTRIRDALMNLGHEISRDTVANILHCHGIEPAPERGKKTSWLSS